jgi:hypothetical protein
MERYAKLSITVVLLLLCFSVLIVLNASGAQSSELVPLPPSVGKAEAAAAIVSDDFNSCVLNDQVWQWVDPQGDSDLVMEGTYTNDAWVSISVPAGTDHNIWTDGNNSARIMQPAPNGDFDIEVKFDSGVKLGQSMTLMPEGEFQMEGILVEQDVLNFLRFELYSRTDVSPTQQLEMGPPDLGTTIYVATFKPGVTKILSPTQLLRQQIGPENTKPLWLRVKRESNDFIAYYSFNGTLWTEAIRFNADDYYDQPFGVTKVGAYAANAGLYPPFTANIDYFLNRASPIASEDGERNSLTIQTDGNGTVNRSPDKANYGCGTGNGELVTLTPIPASGYAFDEWTGPDAGDVVDNGDGTHSITMNGSKEITANFTGSGYGLTIITDVNKGTVERDPQPPYNQVTEVTLTPKPKPGYSFDGWGGTDIGDVTDNGDGTYSITVDENKQLEAKWLWVGYTLTIDIVGQGTVDTDPNGPYNEDEEVELEPIPSSGWSFDGWSGQDAGDLVEKDASTWSLTMDGDKRLTATFVTDQISIYLPLVRR